MNNDNIIQFRSNAKLLLTGEYLVLKGALALALPLNLGQKLEIVLSDHKLIDWVTFEKEQAVFTASFHPNNLEIVETTDEGKAKYIQNLLKAAQRLNAEFLYMEEGLAIKATVEFDMQWGLGSSSTLINNIAQWAKVDAFELNNQVSKGSGYDIACAQNSKPISYQLLGGKPMVKPASFSPPFLVQLNLVYLNQKMATEKNISKFLAKQANFNQANKHIEELTKQFIACQDLDVFIELMQEHEHLIASQIDELPVKERLFKDFNGAIKSLGAWGGDFALVASNQSYKDQEQYFTTKGYETFLPLKELL